MRRYQTAHEMRQALQAASALPSGASSSSSGCGRQVATVQSPLVPPPSSPVATPSIRAGTAAGSFVVRHVHRLRGHDEDITALCFSGDGRLLASGDRAGTVKLWDARRRVELATCGLAHSALHIRAEIDQLLFASDALVAVSPWIGRLTDMPCRCAAWILLLPAGSSPALLTVVPLFEAHCYRDSIRVSGDGRRVAVGWMVDGGALHFHVRVVANGGGVAFEDRGRGKRPPRVGLSRDGAVVAWSSGKALHLSRGGTSVLVEDFEHDIVSLDLSADGTTAVTWSDDGVILWDTRTGTARTRLSEPSDRVSLRASYGTDERTVRFGADGGWGYGVAGHRLRVAARRFCVERAADEPLLHRDD